VHDHKIEKQNPGSQDKKSDTLMGGLLNGVYIFMGWAISCSNSKGPCWVPLQRKVKVGGMIVDMGVVTEIKNQISLCSTTRRWQRPYRLQSRKKSTIDQQLKEIVHTITKTGVRAEVKAVH
jgi:hypothetical protein